MPSRSPRCRGGWRLGVRCAGGRVGAGATTGQSGSADRRTARHRV